ncbi:hypothetical protein EYC08_12250 [Tabrizicola sp. WMC-M-20]|nr:hypothetical protein EYC08_12250 [Tabrizicola sp. WMC-M-20]
MAGTVLEEIVMLSKPYSLSEASEVTSGLDQGALMRSWFSRWLQPLRASVARADKAHALRCELASLPQDVMSDTGLSPEDTTDIASHQPDLPFFMQNGFGRH